MAMRANRRFESGHPAGFTLVELLVATTLLVMIMLATTYIFSGTTQAVTEALAQTEMQVRLARWDEMFRRDVSSIDRQQGFLVFGARLSPPVGSADQAYGSHKQAERELPRQFRNDWVEFITNSEETAGNDGWTKCQWGRIFYGHGQITDSVAWGTQSYNNPMGCMTLEVGRNVDGNGKKLYSPYATDWIVIRNRYLMSEATIPGYDYLGCDRAGGVDNHNSTLWYNNNADYQRTLAAQMARDFRWHFVSGGNWAAAYGVRQWTTVTNADGTTGKQYLLDPEQAATDNWTITVPYGPAGGFLPAGNSSTTFANNKSAVYEPFYYQPSFSDGYNPMNSLGKAWAISHCATFRIRYAMPNDLRAGPNGGVNWHDPDDFYGNPVVIDPTSVITYIPNTNGTSATSNNIYLQSASGNTSPTFKGPIDINTGRKAFAPGDLWPSLLQVTVECFDPDDRLDDSKTFVGVYHIP